MAKQHHRDFYWQHLNKKGGSRVFHVEKTPQASGFQFIWALPFAGQGRALPAQGTRRALHKQRGNKKEGRGRDERFGRKSFSSTVLKTDTNFKTNINSLSLPEEAALDPCLQGREKEVSRFPKGSSTVTLRGGKERSVKLQRSFHNGHILPRAADGSHGTVPPLPILAGTDTRAPQTAGVLFHDELVGGCRQAGGTGGDQAPRGPGHGVIWRGRLRGAQSGARGAAAPPAAATPARPPSAAPPPPAAGSC